jgi:hypothetical protein
MAKELGVYQFVIVLTIAHEDIFIIIIMSNNNNNNDDKNASNKLSEK